MKTLEDLKIQLQKTASIEDSIDIRIRMIELMRENKDYDHSISPVSDLLMRVHQDQKLKFES
ncbi:hypothetical protein [Parabacteroides sp. FAFU027]|uniref:hypothetical protein n=1 Tax=Parabacteroides sp. FAFU027 TaxID=2922715 RepID=UPI001FAF10E4|nr:hypothetical protein [Parabacteroides sp. FAFU027]